MPLELWLTYTVTTSIIIAIPGPTNLMVMAYGLRHGTKTALFTVFGVVPGAVSAMALSFLGLGAMLATSSKLFMLMKWAGAIYLIYLGIIFWRRTPHLDKVPIEDQIVTGKQVALQAFTISLLNPKGIVFYMAFVPQFVSPESPVLPQMLILASTLVAIVFPVNTAYALLSGTLRSIAKNQRVLQVMNRTGGGLLIGAGVVTATLRRNS